MFFKIYIQIRYAGASHADANEYRKCAALWNHALRLKVEKETLLSADTSFTARAIVQVIKMHILLYLLHMNYANLLMFY